MEGGQLINMQNCAAHLLKVSWQRVGKKGFIMEICQLQQKAVPRQARRCNHSVSYPWSHTNQHMLISNIYNKIIFFSPFDKMMLRFFKLMHEHISTLEVAFIWFEVKLTMCTTLFKNKIYIEMRRYPNFTFFFSFLICKHPFYLFFGGGGEDPRTQTCNLPQAHPTPLSLEPILKSKKLYFDLVFGSYIKRI